MKRRWHFPLISISSISTKSEPEKYLFVKTVKLWVLWFFYFFHFNIYIYIYIYIYDIYVYIFIYIHIYKYIYIYIYIYILYIYIYQRWYEQIFESFLYQKLFNKGSNCTAILSLKRSGSICTGLSLHNCSDFSWGGRNYIVNWFFCSDNFDRSIYQS